MGQEKSYLLIEAKKIFNKAGFETSVCDLRCCFDIIAKGKTMTFLVIIAPNIDSVPNEYVRSIKCLSYYFKAHPIIIGSRTKTMELLKGVVYTRDEIPSLSIETLEELVIENAPPLVYSDRGGIYVRINGDILKKIRESMGASLNEFAKEIGISRTTLYEYEHSKRGVELDTALKIEDLIDYPLIKPVDIIDNVIEKGSSKEEEPKSDFEKHVFELFDNLGFKVHPTKRAPFDAVVKEDKKKTDMIMLTGVSDLNPRSIKRRILIVHDVSKVLDRDAFFVINAERPAKSIDGVPIVMINEIMGLKDCDTVIELLKERKKECDDELD
ncbi:MAG: transcriptional regulator [Candidatus Methanofastidiosa archaeon]|nr:transcriptional regulator [Candidatus Methanofastidiosa archaeon]